MLTTNILHNHVDCLPMTLIFELCKMSKLPKGAFNNYVDRFCHFLLPPLCVDSFYTLSVDKNRHFLTPSPLHLVHVIFECPLNNIANV